MALPCIFPSRSSTRFLVAGSCQYSQCQGLGFLHDPCLYGSSAFCNYLSLFFSARADQMIPAEKLLAIIVGIGAILTALAFFVLEQGKNPIFFLVLFGLNH